MNATKVLFKRISEIVAGQKSNIIILASSMRIVKLLVHE